ncbi:MAG TPA: hypothetical protein VKM72_26425 [Thermoanaerobaculia bacterium]|nr:hypothetical protein [Thermoanaerobaculia bacterium]
MKLDPRRARAVLPRVDPARKRGWPVGLRDGALLGLLAAGLTAEELAGLQASAITMDRGTLRVTVHRHGFAWSVALTADVGGHLIAWISERRLWGTAQQVFTGPRGSLTPVGVRKVLIRYCTPKPAPARRRRRRRTP